MAKSALKEVTHACYVVDFTEDTSFFVHKVENGARAETLARLLRTVFSGADRPLPSSGKDGIEAYKAYKTLEEIQKKLPDVKVKEFAGLIPSLNRALDKIGVKKGGGRNLTSDQQDKLFLQCKKFFARITPVEEAKVQVA
jgi:hypothetical protein